MTLTKTTMAEKLTEKLDLPTDKAQKALEILLDIMKETIINGEEIMISGFGKFHVNEKKARKGRNPATSSEMILAARKVVTFNCSGKLKEKLNNKSNQ